MEDQNIPIDINSGKLLEWLINRRHCTKEWQTKVLNIREKINNAIQDMPAHEEIVKLLSGTYINYFHCIKIIEILKETEADTRNLFGRYGSQRMKDWQEIVYLYEKDNVYLAEAAQMLMRNINYEVPALKKQVQKLQQQHLELEKKETEYKKSEGTAKSEFAALCKQLDIAGQNIKQELADKVTELPGIYEKIADKTKCIENVVEFYSAFVQFTLGRLHDNGCVPIIKYVIDKGNTTTYEWTYGEAPLSVVEPPLNISFDNDDDSGTNAVDINTEEIDFSGLNLNGDIELSENINLDVGDIDWGDVSIDEGSPEDINYNVSLEESGIVVEAAGHEGGYAIGNDAYTILDNPVTRCEFINQVQELEAFLKLRLHEFKNDNSKNILSVYLMLDAAPILQLSTAESTQKMLDNVQIVLSEVCDYKLQHIHKIKHSLRYVDVLASSLKQKLILADRMVESQKAVRRKCEEVQAQITTLQPLLTLIVKKTKELQGEIEQDISKKYKNRIVHLTGVITTL